MSSSQSDDFWETFDSNSVDERAFQNELQRLNNVFNIPAVSQTKKYVCKLCNTEFSKNSNLKRHVDGNRCTKRPKTVHSATPYYACPLCSTTFANKFNLDRHCRQKSCINVAKENSTELNCNRCNRKFSKTFNYQRHMKTDCLKTKSYICDDCGKTFMKEGCLTKHQRNDLCDRGRHLNSGNSEASGSSFLHGKPVCLACNKNFANKASLMRHKKRNVCQTKFEKVFQCNKCKKMFSSAAYLKQHYNRAHPLNQERNPDHGSDGIQHQPNINDEYDDIPSQDNYVPYNDGPLKQYRCTFFGNTMIRYRLTTVDGEQNDMLYFFGNRREQLKSNITREMSRLRTLKWYVAVKVKMERVNVEGAVVDEATPVFRSVTKPILSEESISEQINDAYLKMMKHFDSFRESGSGWRLKSVENMEQTLVTYRPLRGSCYNYVIPDTLLRKNCLLNVTGPPALDGDCFRYSLLAALHTDEELVGNIPWADLHQYRDTISFEGIEGSGKHMPITDIEAFENKNNISINLYGYEEYVFPIHISSNKQRQKHVDLLILQGKSDVDDGDDDGDTEDVHFASILDNRKSHYCVIKSLKRLVSSQVGRHCTDICRRCLTPRYTNESMAEHELICSKDEDHVLCSMPVGSQKWLKFRNYGRLLKVSFVIVANFVCYTSPLYSHDEPTEGYETRERRLDPCAYSYQRISIDGSHPKEPVVYVGSDADDTMEHFLADMAAEEAEVFQITERTVPTILCDDGLRNLQSSNDTCFVCKDPFLPGERQVVDHSHVSGKIRGRCHNACNLRLKEANFLPVVLENLSKHEGRLIMQAIGKFGADAVDVIPQTLDTFVSISIKRCRYLDFSRFLKTPLDDLVDSVRAKSGFDAFHFVKRNIPAEYLDISIGKQYMFTDYLDSSFRLSETSLPPLSAFSDRIKDTHLTDEEYRHVERLWTSFQMSDINCYITQYLKTRCLLFADVVEDFRQVLMHDFSLDPMHYYSLPGYSFDCCLYRSEVTLELMTDEDMHNTVLQALRGGVTVVGSPRICSANSPGLPDFDPDSPVSRILFLDFNSLYPSCMIDYPLPIYGFRYLTEFDIDRLNIMDIPKDSDKGYIFVVDLEYPEELHDRDDGYPMCPENAVITKDMLSPYTHQLAEKCGIKLKDDRKLCQTFHDKTRYATHYLTLQHYLSHGMVLKRIHRVIEFTQSRWLEEFMTYTCTKRKEATNEFDAILYKGIANQCFGKTIENQKKRINVRICTNAKQLERLVRKPTFAAARVFSPDLAAVQLFNRKVLLNKPISVGFTILEVSKLRMFQFYHDFLLQAFPEGTVTVLYSDTDSWLINVQGNHDMDSILRANRNRFDFSSLPDDHPLKDDMNRKTPGKLKFELGNSICTESIVLSSKCYSLLTENGTKSALKGVQCNVKHERYKECLLSDTSYSGTTKSVKNFGQSLYHVNTQRRMLTPVDTKRFYLSANKSYSYGHYKLLENL
ncbi:uncharacterized protein LOC123544936 [Mercenaria mercenaria]|uniref:uncharacterized protein LOC123544936 n=1 Tax=Mercenaria mercenaria TaxID=6596 RepID=UPI00234F324B|nr:uncharacterized protein LOC123544936 [Mercenaria mercenaria]XP_053396014.1 uncharacterized protein LOC123544936 [Mercenaria mercenaria]